MKKRILCLGLALWMLLSALAGCGPDEYQQRILDAASNPSGQGAADTTESDVQKGAKDLSAQYKDTAESDEEAAALSREVNLSREALAAMEAAVDGLAVEYPFGDLSGVESAYERYMALPGYGGTAQHGMATNLPLTPEALFELVKANNAAYMEANPILKRFQLEDDFILWACEIICDTLNRELPALGSSAMLADVDSNIADLKISQSPVGGVANASVTDDNCMYLNPTMMKNMITINNNELAEVRVVTHETEHLIQKLSTEARNIRGILRGYGFSVVWEDQQVNSMYFNWLIEASAERLAAALCGCDPETYLAPIGYLDSLSFLNILRGAGAKDTPRLTQQSSLERVFELFGCETEAERVELLRLLYAIEIIQEEPKDFMTLYAEMIGHEPVYGEVTQLKIQLKNAACQTLSKYFYRNLARLAAEKPMSLREVFYLITLFESDLNLHIIYSDESFFGTIRPFLESYVMLQQAFFDGLAESLSLTPQELHEYFTALHYRTEIPKDSILHGKSEWHGLTITPLSQEANDFLYEFGRSVLKKKSTPVQAMTELLF